MDLGTLVGSLQLEDSQFGQVLAGAVTKLTNFGTKGVKLAGAAGAAIALALGASLVQGMNVEAANNKLSAQLGLTEAESKRIGKVAGKLYAAAYGESLEDVNDAVAAVMTSIDGMATASSKDLEKVTAKTLDFATAFEVDVARAAQIAGQLISTGLAKDANNAFDLMVAGTQGLTTALREDLLDAIDEYGPAFAQLGYTGEQAFNLLRASSEKGMYGIDKAGDAIKEFVIRASDLGDSGAQDALKSIGLSGQDMANDLLAGGDKASKATSRIIDGLLSIEDPGAQASAAIALFGTPLEDLNKGEIPAFLKSLKGVDSTMGEVEGASDRMGKTLNKGATTSLTSLKRQAQTTFAGLMNWALPAVNKITAAMAESFGPALQAVGEALAWLAEKTDALFAPLGGNTTILTVLAGVIGVVLVGAFAAWAVSATAAAVATAAAWLIALGPIPLVIAAIVAVVGLIVANWDKIKAVTGAAWSWVTGFLRDNWQKILAIVAGPIGIIVGLVIRNWDKIKATTAAVWNWVKSFTSSTWSSVSGAVSRGVSNVIGFVKGLPGKVKSALSGAGGWLLSAGKDIMRGLRDGIEAGFDWVRSKLQGVGRLIPGWLKKVLGISSPSKVMRDQVGLWIPAGVADGVERGTARYLNPALARMAAAAVTPITGTGDFQDTVAKLNTPGVNPFGAPGMDGTGTNPALVQNVFPQPGMSEQQVADMAAGRIMFALENG